MQVHAPFVPLRASRLTTATRGPSEIAAECRSVGLLFLNAVARDADPRTFFAWATRDYVRVATVEEREPHGQALAILRATRSSLREALREARATVLSELQSGASSRDGARFAELSVCRGLVTPSYNVLAIAPRRNERGWVPVDRPDARLDERILALFAVDYLWKPALYHEAFYVCPQCEAVVFDDEARARGLCGAHPKRPSFVRSRAAGLEGRASPPAAASVRDARYR